MFAAVAAAGKSAKKNQKRAAKRKETTGSTSMGEPSSTNLSGWGEGFGSGAGSEAGGSEHNPLMGNTKFITGRLLVAGLMLCKLYYVWNHAKLGGRIP